MVISKLEQGIKLEDSWVQTFGNLALRYTLTVQNNGLAATAFKYLIGHARGPARTALDEKMILDIARKPGFLPTLIALGLDLNTLRTPVSNQNCCCTPCPCNHNSIPY